MGWEWLAEDWGRKLRDGEGLVGYGGKVGSGGFGCANGGCLIERGRERKLRGKGVVGRGELFL